MTRLVLFIFAGRQANMEVQMPYLDRILRDYPEAELHLWDLTRNSVDQSYVRGLEGAHEGRVRILTHLHPGFPMPCLYPGGVRRRRYPACECIIHKPPYEQPYLWYASQPEYDGTVFVKMDDDVLFLETDRFNDLILPLSIHPNRVISANVVNNAVCAKYEPELVKINAGEMYDPRDPKFDRFWWAAHTSPEFAMMSHNWFLGSAPRIMSGLAGKPSYVRTRPGEAVSINCIAFTHTTMKRMAKAFEFNPRLGDEGVVDSFLPWIARSFHAAHLTFGPQDAAMTKDQLWELRMQYGKLAKEWLS